MRRTLDDWAGSFRAWMDDPNFEHGVLSSIAFDFRRVAGPLDPEPVLDRIVRDGRARPSFVRMLGRKAVTLHPPTGFFRDLVVEDRGEHADRLDVKHGGITIATNLARCWGIRAGSSAKGTPARLRAAVDAELIDDETAIELEQAFRFLWEIRLRHQAAQVAAGADPNDFIDPAALGSFQRSGLKEAFRALVRAQKLMASQLGIDAR
jgi:CBS domain-containing protein